MRVLWLAVLLVAWAFGWTSPTHAEKRVALVIGNDDYSTLPDLNNARKDATDMAAKLRGLGFEVIVRLDAKGRDMGRALVDFENRLAKADVGLVFYAGHGIQAYGRNYLIPADAEVEVEEDLRYEGVEAKDFLDAMGRSGAPMNIVILDACRDNPLPKRTRSAARGLAVVGIPQGTKGTAVLYSAGEGQAAQDGPPGGNGVFTGELLKVLDRPGLTLEQVFKRVAKGVGDRTHGKQRPWSLTSLQGDFYFTGGARAASPSAGPSGGMTAEMMFWNSIQGDTNPASFQAYLSQYPNGSFAALARVRIAELTAPQVVSLPPAPAFQVAPVDEEMVAAKTANVRAEPIATSSKIGRLEAGTKVDVTGKTTVSGATWYRVALAGKGIGYVFGTLLTEIAAVVPRQPSPPPSPVKPAVGIYPDPIWKRPLTGIDLPCGTAKLIVPWSAGGGTDVIMRIITKAMNMTGAKPQIQIVNIGGQGGNRGAKEAAKAKRDGCTLFAIHQSAITSYFTGRVDFSVEAFEPVALLTRTPTIFGANRDVPYDNLRGLVAYAKRNPYKVVAGGTLGSTSHFIMLLLEDAAGIRLKHIPYDGTRARMTALLAKNIEMGEINLAAAKKYILTGELKALGITTEERNPEAPDVMTAKEQGIDLIYGTDRGIVLPKGTPQGIVGHYAGLFGKVMADPTVSRALSRKGTMSFFVPTAEYKAYLDATFAHWNRLAREAGVYKRRD